MSSPLRIALVGYGAMGHEIESHAAGRGFDVSARIDSQTPVSSLEKERFDVAIEFTRPAAALENIRALVEMGKPVVVGTTGWLESLGEVERLVREHKGRVLYGSNFSIGVNLFFSIVRHAAALFNDEALYDIAIHEIHHTRKADSPSGTARSLAHIVLEEIERKTCLLTETSHGPIPPDALHITSQRLGATTGTHSVIVDSEADTIEIIHRAKNRSGFALGALLGAEWLSAQPSGLYRFEDLYTHR